MSLLPPPPSSAEPPKGESSNALPEGYHQQFEIVLQILKDRVNRYDRSRVSPENQRPNTTPPDEISSGHSHLTTAGLSNDIYRQSERLVEDELDVLRERNPYAWWAINTYFDVDNGHGDFDFLAAQAETNKSAAQTFATLQMALYMLVSRLMDKHLHCRWPAKVDTRTNRRRTMEEHYAEIARVYKTWCKELKAANPNDFSTMEAKKNTALQLNCSTKTVTRALKFQSTQQKG